MRLNKMSRTKILFVTDIHGSETTFKKFLNASKMYKVDVAIVGGDITGKGLVFISKTAKGFEAEFLGKRWLAKNDEELQSLTREIRKRGFYVHVDEPKAIEEIRSSPAKAEKLLTDYIIKTVREWAELAVIRLKDSGIKCYISPGNDDIYEIDDVLNTSDYIINPEEKVVMLDNEHEMISTGKVNVTPWKCPRDVSEEKLNETIEKLVSQLNNPRSSIFNFHAPPFNTYLDVAPELDENLRQVVKAGQLSMVNVGSTSVRKAIEKYQPLLGLHGHIHESKAVEKIGNTICINPGSEYAEGILNGAIIIIEAGKVKDYMFIRG
jgi:Icc-related predicted phosphoesterase